MSEHAAQLLALCWLILGLEIKIMGLALARCYCNCFSKTEAIPTRSFRQDSEDTSSEASKLSCFLSVAPCPLPGPVVIIFFLMMLAGWTCEAKAARGK